MSITVNKKYISEYINENGINNFDFESLLCSINESEIISEIVNSDFNPGFHVYNEKFGPDLLAVNVKTHIGYKMKYELPNFLKTFISENDIQEEIEAKYNNSEIYQFEFEDWENNSKNLGCEFGVSGKGGGYWTYQNFNAGKCFKPEENDAILKGLKAHLLKEFENKKFDNKDEMLSEFDDSIENLFNKSAYDLDDHLNYIKNDLNLITWDNSFMDLLTSSYELAKSKVEYYENRENLIREMIYSNDSIPNKDELIQKYDEYIQNKQIEELNIPLNDAIKINIPLKNKIILEFIVSTIDPKKPKISIINPDLNNLNELKLNGVNLEDYLKDKDVISKCKDIKELLNFSKLFESNFKIEPQVELFKIVGVIKPESINKTIFLNQKIQLNKNNEFELKRCFSVKDNVSELECKISKIKNSFDFNDLIKDLTKINFLPPESKLNQRVTLELEKIKHNFNILSKIESTKQIKTVEEISKKDWSLDNAIKSIGDTTLSCIQTNKENTFIKPPISKILNKSNEISI